MRGRPAERVRQAWRTRRFGLGQLALRRLLSAPDRTPGCPHLRPSLGQSALPAAVLTPRLAVWPCATSRLAALLPMPLLVPVMAMESAAAGTRRSRQLASTDENMGVSVSRRGRVARRRRGVKKVPKVCLSRDHAYCTVGMILPDVITPACASCNSSRGGGRCQSGDSARTRSCCFTSPPPS